MRLKYFNALALPPDLYIILHSLTVHKYAGQQLHKCNYALKFKILVQKCPFMSFCLISYDKEIVVDFRRVHTQHAPLTINDATVERVSSTKFLGVHITEDNMQYTAALAKKAQQRLYFLRKLRRARAPTPSCAPSTEAPSRAF